MATYKFNLIETYSKIVEVEANNHDEAFDKLSEQVSSGDVTALEVSHDEEGDYNFEIYSIN